MYHLPYLVRTSRILHQFIKSCQNRTYLFYISNPITLTLIIKLTEFYDCVAVSEWAWPDNIDQLGA